MIKLKDILTEAKKLDQKHLDKLNKMTQGNNHLGARTHLSYYVEGGNKGKFFKYYFKLEYTPSIFFFSVGIGKKILCLSKWPKNSSFFLKPSYLFKLSCLCLKI